jgi:hypothetical protein
LRVDGLDSHGRWCLSASQCTFTCTGLPFPFRRHQEEAYEAKRIKAEMLAEEKRHMQDNMTARRVALAKEEQRYTSAIATMRSSQRCVPARWVGQTHHPAVVI